MTDSNYNYDDSSRLTEDSRYFYAYDPNGNLTRKVAKLDALTTVYSYDPLERLAAVREWRYPWQAATTGVIIYGGNHANKLILSQNIQSPPLSTC